MGCGVSQVKTITVKPAPREQSPLRKQDAGHQPQTLGATADNGLEGDADAMVQVKTAASDSLEVGMVLLPANQGILAKGTANVRSQLKNQVSMVKTSESDMSKDIPNSTGRLRSMDKVRAAPVFLSFARKEGVGYAKQLCEALQKVGVLSYGYGAYKEGGEAWLRNVGQHIDGCRLFVAVTTPSYGGEDESAGQMSTWDDWHYAVSLNKRICVLFVEAAQRAEVQSQLKNYPSYHMSPGAKIPPEIIAAISEQVLVDQ